MKKPENLFKHWWWIVLCAIIFAGISNLLAILLPGQYEQSANLQILFEPTQEINWTDKDMVSFTEKMGLIAGDEATIAKVIESMEAQGYTITKDELARYTSKERRFYGWKLIITTNDENLTETLLDTWYKVVIETIEQDLALSKQTQQQAAIAAAWIPCLQQLPAEPVHPVCNPENAAMIAQLYHEVFNNYQTAKDQIQYLDGYPPNYSIEPMEISTTQHIPRVDRSTAILIGLIIGILIGAITIQTPWTSYLGDKRGEP